MYGIPIHIYTPLLMTPSLAYLYSSLLMTPSLALIKLWLPRKVLISPLCANILQISTNTDFCYIRQSKKRDICIIL